MKKVFLSVILLFSASVSAAPLSLDVFLKRYLDHSESLQKEKSQLNSAGWTNKINQDVYSANLIVSSEYEDRQYSLTQSGVSQDPTKANSAQVLFQWNQKIPLGGDLSLSRTEYFNQSQLNDSSPVGSFGLSWTQSLLRDFAGNRTRSEQRQGDAQYRASKFEYNWKKSNVCAAGVETYLDAFVAQSQHEVLQQVLKASNRSSKIVERAYRRKLIRKIDVLALRSEHLRVQNRYFQAGKDMDNELVKLVGAAQLDKADTLAYPKMLDQLPLASGDLLNSNYEVQKLQSLVDAAVEGKYISDSKDRGDIQLQLAYDQTDGEVTSASPVEDYDNRTLTVGVSLDWDVFGSTNRAQRNLAYEKMKRAQWTLAEKKRTIGEQKEILQSALSYSKKSVELLQAQVKNLEAQVKEGLRLLNAGKLNINEYINYQDRLLSEKIKLTEQRAAVWKVQIQLLSLFGNVSAICMEGN